MARLHPETKLCRKCGQRKPLTEFGRHALHADGRQSNCKLCKRAKDRAYHAANRERISEYGRAYHQKHRERNLAKMRRYYESNRDQIREAQRRYYEENDEDIRERVSEWRDENPEKRREHSRWRRARVRLKGRAAKHTLMFAELVRNDPCAYCGKPASVVDHIEAIAIGGRHSWENFTGACRSCNSRKCTTALLPFLLKRTV